MLNLIDGLRGRHRAVVNLGAGDGYYGIGLVSNGMFEQSICFELTESGQESLRRTAAKNGVQHKVRVLGAAGPDFAKAIGDLGLKPSDCLIVCDIEGAEFSIFTPDCLASLRGAHIIVELHGCFMPNGPALEQNLIASGSQFFDASLAKTSMRDLSGISELEMMNDSDRWLICSESRPKLMSWLLLAPKA